MLLFSTKIFFFDMFFFNVTFVNFNNMREYCYSFVFKKLSSLIINNEIKIIIKKNKSNNISKSNDIFNKIFKMLISFLFSILTILFRVCVSQKYYFRCFRETHYNIKKISQIRLFQNKNVQIHYFVEYVWQNSRINYNQTY